MQQAWLSSSALTSPLVDLLSAEAINPGDAPSYGICKLIYEAHPFGKKMVDNPLKLAMSQERTVEVPTGPERVKNEFLNKRREIRADFHIQNFARVARIYGLGTLSLIVEGQDPGSPIDLASLYKKRIGFNVLDPLNVSGSTVLNQDPNDINFQRTATVVVSGKVYHASRTCVLMNEAPLYIGYTKSAFGYSGRSVYQRALYPLKSFVQSMRTDDLLMRKVGVIIAKIQQVGSTIDNVIGNLLGFKRQIVKDAMTDDVISIGPSDTIESLNLQNLDAPYAQARKNVIENLALSADMPAILLNQESFAEGFGEGTEDAKNVARFVDGIREWMKPAYDFTDDIAQWLAWTPEFFETIKAEFPEDYGGVTFEAAFYRWRNSFTAVFPNLLTEPDSEKIKVDETRFKTAVAAVQVLSPDLDPENKAAVYQWLTDLISSQKLLFPVPLVLDFDTLTDFIAQKQAMADQAAANALEDPMGEGGGGKGEGEGTDKKPPAPVPFSAAA